MPNDDNGTVPLPPLRPWERPDSVSAAPNRADEPIDVLEDMDEAPSRSRGSDNRASKPVAGRSVGRGWLWGLLAVGVVGLLLFGCLGTGAFIFVHFVNGLTAGVQPPKSVTEAVQKLQTNDADQQKSAATWLAVQPIDSQQQRQVALALDPLIGDPNPAVSEAAVRALTVWATADNVLSLVALVESQPDSQITIFGTLSPAAEKRTRAVNVLAKMDDDRALSVLAGAAMRGNSNALASLERTAPKGQKALLPYFNDPAHSASARDLLRKMNTPERDLLQQSLKDLRSNDFTVRRNAATYFAQADVDEGLRPEVARALGPLVANLDALAQANDPFLVSLSRWATKESIPVLLGLTGPGHWPGIEDRVWDTLATLNDEEAAAKIIQTWHQEALGRRGPWRSRIFRLGPLAEPALLKLVDTPDSWRQQQVCEMLGEVGTKASVPALQAIQAKPAFGAPSVQASATHALEQIDKRGK